MQQEEALVEELRVAAEGLREAEADLATEVEEHQEGEVAQTSPQEAEEVVALEPEVVALGVVAEWSIIALSLELQ